MEDSLPLKMFRKEYLIQAYEHGNFNMVLLLLPCVMLTRAVMHKSLQKSNIIWLLTHVYAFIAVYFECLDIDPEQKDKAIWEIRKT